MTCEEVADNIQQNLDLFISLLLVFKVGSHIESLSLLGAVANALSLLPYFVFIVGGFIFYQNGLGSVDLIKL